jgi:hypothetical protein
MRLDDPRATVSSSVSQRAAACRNFSGQSDLWTFVALLALAVVGRWAQPAWHFTPLAAVTAWGGFTFRHWAPAALLPIAALAISDLRLPSHDHGGVMATVYAMTALPWLLGRAARGGSLKRQVACWGMCGLLPATAFFLVTNFAVWAFQSAWEPTWQGLLECYAAGIPFYRTMLAGDLCYLSLLAGCWLAANGESRKLAEAAIRLRD